MDKNYMLWMAGIAILGIIVTAIRAGKAKSDSEALEEHNALKQKDNANKVEEAMQAVNLNSDLAFSTECASVSVDSKAGKMLILSQALKDEKMMLNLSEIVSIQVINNAEEYQHCQEMERLRSGVERKSLYNPYGSFSNREVKEGHARFEAFKGALVYGLGISCRGQGELQIAFYRGNDSVYWHEDERLHQFIEFAENLKKIIADHN